MKVFQLNPGLVPADHLVVALPVVLLLPAVLSLAAGSVEPEAEDLPVLGGQFGQLGRIVIIVGLAGAVAGVVPVVF